MVDDLGSGGSDKHTHAPDAELGLQDRPSIRAIINYALKNSAQNDKFQLALQESLGPAGLQSANHVGLIFSERLINMPVQLMPPAYRMLEEELRWAMEDVSASAPLVFTHVTDAPAERAFPVLLLPLHLANVQSVSRGGCRA